MHSVHARPCRIYEQSGPQNTQPCTTHGNAHNGSGSYLRPKTHIHHTHSQHISTHTHLYKSLKHSLQQDGVTEGDKSVMRPALEYVSSIWSSLASSASINKLQVMQNTALRTATGCTQDTTYNICMTKHSHFP